MKLLRMPFSLNKKTTAFRWLLNIILALLILCNNEAGRLLGIQWIPLHFSAVWPATGFSLAALLLFGFSMWPGIFFGNFCYNLLHLYSQSQMFLVTLLISATIALGSTLQAVVGGYIIRRYATAGYFNTVKDAVIFLFGGGVLTCMISSTISVGVLAISSDLSINQLFYTWLTIWLGDTMGVYIFTPLVVVWSIHKSESSLLHHLWELPLMLLAFAAVSYFTLRGYPLGYLFIPYNLWITYRFGLHGATFAMIFIALATIIPITLCLGPFIVNFSADMLLIIVSFLEIIVASFMLFAAVINERDAAWRLIKAHRLDVLDVIAAKTNI